MQTATRCGLSATVASIGMDRRKVESRPSSEVTSILPLKLWVTAREQIAKPLPIP
ncbi:MAG: hypothetical protein HC871_01765 [Rhizobiales bacterium]|nr:hypothetical protein [Hyphomicrobiales bacterium]